MVAVAVALSVGLFAGCSSDSSSSGGDGGPDGGGPGGEVGGEAGGEAGGEVGGLALTGTVTDQAGVPVARAKLEVGAASVFSDPQGRYTLPLAASGPVSLKVTRNWFNPLESSVTAAATGATNHDVVLQEIPLKLEAADQTLLAAYNSTFDVRTSKVSIAVAARPTRREFDNAVFYKNPALYKNPTAPAPVRPTPAPQIFGATASNFTFPLKSGRNQGQQAVELASIVDTLAATGLAAADAAAFMVWTPALKWIGESSEQELGDLTAAGAGVRQQDWGGGMANPQEIQRLWVDSATNTLWVEISFASFLELGPGVNDDDGDGRKEIFAKLAGVHYTPAVAQKLVNDYAKTLFTTHGLSNHVSKSLNDLYSQTAAQVERYIGEPYELAGVGQIKYPFLVLSLLGGFKNIILVGP